MQPQTRQAQILARMAAIRKEWKVAELAAVMQVSPITIRRDLEGLARAGVVIRTLGGCLISDRRQMAAYHERVADNFELKQAVGRAAANEIKPGDVLLINDGSTTYQMAACLGDCGRITVYTNSVAMIGEISRFPNVRLNVLGGEYHPDLFVLGGSLMQRVLETIRADVVFMGTDAIDAKGRCLVLDQDSARTAEMMLRCGRRKILLADGRKVNARGQVAYAGLRDFDLWITTPGIPGNLLKKFRKQTAVREA